MSDCCDDYFCKRRKPILIRRGGLTNRWYAVTSYTTMVDHPQTVRSANGGKHDITEQIEAIREDARQEGYEAGLAERSAATAVSVAGDLEPIVLATVAAAEKQMAERISTAIAAMPDQWTSRECRDVFALTKKDASQVARGMAGSDE